MREPIVRGVGLAASLVYAALIAWLYASQPQTMAQVSGGLTSMVGAYRIDQQAFDEGLQFFRHDQFVEARSAFGRADKAQRDSRTQFYIAYSYYRQGWGRLHDDDELFHKGIEAIDRAIAVAPGGRVVVDDPNLMMHSADELRAELDRGATIEPSDFNPLRVFRERK